MSETQNIIVPFENWIQLPETLPVTRGKVSNSGNTVLIYTQAINQPADDDNGGMRLVDDNDFNYEVASPENIWVKSLHMAGIISLTEGGPSVLKIDARNQKTAFNEQSVAELTPVAQYDFSYNINPELWNIRLNGGTSVVDQHLLKLSTGAAANQSAYILSRVPIKASAGQGALARFSGIFTAGVTGSRQFIGNGDVGDALLFVMIDDVFGVAKFAYGVPSFETLTITTGSSTAENVTVTLDGIASSVPVTASGNTTTTANEIAAFDYSSVGIGWQAHAIDSRVIFENFRAGPRIGVFSIAGTTVVGAMVTTLQGALPDFLFIPQADWNGDKMPNLDPTKGNMYQIKYQAGFGQVEFCIDDELTGNPVVAHTIRYANKNILPSLNTPSLPIVYFAENITNTTDIIVRSANASGFIEGREGGSGIRHAVRGENLAVPAGVETPIISLHNPLVFAGTANRSDLRLKYLIASVDGNKNAVINVYTNATLTNASFSDVRTGISISQFDTSATAITGGDFLFSFPLEKVGDEIFNLVNDKIELLPGDVITFSVESANATESIVSVNYEDLF